jgi:radical SAM superfamily enzyme YgiQ (UPF0313 family)
MKLLLINPRFPESFWSFKWALDTFRPSKRTLNPPLGLATLAALTPDHWDIEIIDENIETVPLRPDADVVGVCGMGVQLDRQKELLSFYRGMGYYVVAGGSFASLCPENYETLADTVVAGEAEYIWPQFCRDFEAGTQKPLYQETGTVSLVDSPAPRFDLLDLSKYQAVSLQYSRGCPFRCEFCDIIVMFGRKPRTKPVEHVGRELDQLRAQNVKSVFFVDDNLIGNKPRAKDLLRFLRDYQQKHNYRFHFGTEASLNMAHDEELLGLFHDANFTWVFIGIESPDEDSLRETKKLQNTKQDIVSSIRKIYSFGVDVLGGFIIGFDNDTTATFEKQREFITRAGIQSAMIGLLTAVPRTPLYERLEKEGRLASGSHAVDNSKLKTNVIPKGMTYDEMIDGYRDLHYQLFSNRGIADRIRNKLRFLSRPVYQEKYSTREMAWLFHTFAIRALLPGGWSRIYNFFRSVPANKPRMFPLVVSEWVTGLSMRSYMDRYFVREFQEDTRRVRNYVEKIKTAYLDHRHRGELGVSFREIKNRAAAVSFSMKGLTGRDSFRNVTRHAEYLLGNTRSSITLNISDLHHSQIEQLKRLLNRLSRYGDRVHIRIDEASQKFIAIDSSIFNLVLRAD